jgi:3D (Asp-Asp-Asp) domain-containing protein
MKKVRLIGGVMMLGVFVLSACGRGQPDIAVALARHDFGQVKQGQVVATEIAMRNTGKSDLTIEAVSTSCGCTTARVEPKVIPPGGEGRLIIRYDSGAHPDSGRVRRHVYIASNDPSKKEVEVIITADVQPPSQ